MAKNYLNRKDLISVYKIDDSKTLKAFLLKSRQAFKTVFGDTKVTEGNWSSITSDTDPLTWYEHLKKFGTLNYQSPGQVVDLVYQSHVYVETWTPNEDEETGTHVEQSHLPNDQIKIEPIVTEMKNDILFLIGLQKDKQNKVRNQWDMNLFKSGFYGKLKTMKKNWQQEKVDKSIEMIVDTANQMNLKPVFTKNHRIYQLHSKPERIIEMIGNKEKTIRQPVLKSLEVTDPVLIRVRDKYNKADNNFDKNRVLDDFVYGIAGKRNAGLRQSYLYALTGKQPSKTLSGIGVLKVETKRWIDETSDTKGQQDPEAATIEVESEQDMIGKKAGNMEEVTMYYKINSQALEDYLALLKSLKDYTKNVIAFSAGIGEDYLIVTGDYDKNAAMHPLEPTEDFDDIISNAKNITYKRLNAKPQPEKRWQGKWVNINDRIKRIESVLKDEDNPESVTIEVESDQAMQEAEQEFKESNAVGTIRPDFIKGVLKGREITLSMPNGEKRRSQFIIAELSEIKASHDEENFHSTVGYPKGPSGNNINDRNYTDDASAQKAVMDYARELEPERLITTSRTPSGTPIVTVDGFVVSGNNRTMSLKLAAKEYKGNYRLYIQYLTEEIEAYGFDRITATAILMKDSIALPGSSYYEPKKVIFDHPVLVRIDYDFQEYTTQELAKYNKDTKKSERPLDKAIKYSNILIENPNCANIIAEIVGEYETFSEFYANTAAQKKLALSLIECNIFTIQEFPAYFSGTTFTEAGKEFVENLLAALVLNREALIASELPGVKGMKQKLITALPVLMKNANLPEGSLKDNINDAVLMQQKIKAAESTFEDFIRQQTIFGDKYDRKTVYLNRLIDSGKFKFKRAIEGYNDSVMQNQGSSLFGEKPSTDEIFKHWIINGVDQTEAKLIEISPIVQSKTDKVNVVSEEITYPTQTPDELNDIDPDYDNEKGVKYLKIWKEQMGAIMAGIPDKIKVNQGEGSDNMKLFATNNLGYLVGEIDLNRNLQISNHRGKEWQDLLQKIADRLNQLLSKPITPKQTEIVKPEWDKMQEFIEETDKEMESKPEKYYIVTKSHWSYGKDTIGKLIKEPNTFEKELYFGKNMSGQKLTGKVDNSFLARVNDPVKLVVDGQSEKFVVEREVQTEEPKKGTQMDYLGNLRFLKSFIGPQQIEVLGKMYRTEEKEYFIDMVAKLVDRIENMPSTYETENTPSDEKIVYLHYFSASSDWYIVKKDKGVDGEMEPVRQYQAFGYAVLNGDTQNAEWGYVSIDELKNMNVEMDLYWDPKPFKEVMKSENQVQDSAKEYKYYMLYRPFGIGTYPPQWFLRFEKYIPGSNAPVHGTVVYSQKLEPATWSKFDLFPITELEEIEKKEYKNEYYERIVVKLSGINGVNIEQYEKDNDPEPVDSQMLNARSVVENVSSGFWKEIDHTALPVVDAQKPYPKFNVGDTVSFEISGTTYKGRVKSYIWDDSELFGVKNAQWLYKITSHEFGIFPESQLTLVAKNDEGLFKTSSEPIKTRSEFMDNLHELDLWQEFEGRHYRKFILNPENERDVTDLGIKERMRDITKGGKDYIEAIISIPSINDSLEDEIEAAYQENTGIEVTLNKSADIRVVTERVVGKNRVILMQNRVNSQMKSVTLPEDEVSKYNRNKQADIDTLWKMSHKIENQSTKVSNVNIPENTGIKKPKLFTHGTMVVNNEDGQIVKVIGAEGISSEQETRYRVRYDNGHTLRKWASELSEYTPDSEKTSETKNPEPSDLVEIDENWDEETGKKYMSTWIKHKPDIMKGFDYLSANIDKSGTRTIIFSPVHVNLHVGIIGLNFKTPDVHDYSPKYYDDLKIIAGRIVEFSQPKDPEPPDLIEEMNDAELSETIINTDYDDDFQLNKAIEKLLDNKWNDNPENWTIEEKLFIKRYSGAGGLDEEAIKAGFKLDKGSLYEFYTPDLVIQKMWGLAYKYGYQGGPVLEPSIGVGRFFDRKYITDYVVKEGYEPNKYSAKICRVLYPEIDLNKGKESMYFEELFLKNNYTIKGNVIPRFSLVIGNPPYGKLTGKYIEMGEKGYTNAKNYIDYFIFRSLDLLEPDGLLIFIIGAELAGGGTLWLDQGGSKVKDAISQKANLIDAYRLPENVFDRTGVASDIIVMRRK
jgi:hypothetical protein